MLGMLFGMMGTWRSLNIAITSLMSRDELVASLRQLVEANTPPPPDAGVARPSGDGGQASAPTTGGPAPVPTGDGGQASAPSAVDRAAATTGDGGAASAPVGDGGVVTVAPLRGLLAPAVRPVGDRAQLLALAEAEADADFARRGLRVPLMIMNLILSLLLFASCARALRGLPSAISMWSWCVMLSVPYQLLSCAAEYVQAREKLHALDSVGVSAAVSFGLRSTLELYSLGTILATGMLVLYYAICWLYLRRLGGLSDGE